MVNKSVKKNDELAVVLEKSGLDIDRVQTLTKSFGEYFKEAQDIVTEASAIVITDENQVEEMQLARKYRLQLKNVRVNTEKKRKEMKEQALREGRAIDGAANIIKALLVPVEKYLEEQEKFIEIKEASKKEQVRLERVCKLQKYVGEDVSVYQLKEMSEEAFEKLLATSKSFYEVQEKERQKLEEDRIAKEKEAIEEQKRIKAENEKLKKEKEEREKVLAAERKAQEQALEKERAKLAAEKAKQAEILKKEQEKREKIEAKIRAEKEEQELLKKQKEEEQKKALLAPDKQKLIAFANLLDKIEIPNPSNREVGRIVDEAQVMINQVSQFLRDKAKKL